MHRLARRKQITVTELAGHAWTAPSHDGLMVRACRAAGCKPSLNIITGDPLAILYALLQTPGARATDQAFLDELKQAM